MSSVLDRSAAARVQSSFEKVQKTISSYLRGKRPTVEQALVCLLSEGHLLLEDLPGVGKTTLAYCLARSLDCSFSRIQFTSDLLPGDVIGVSVFNEKIRDFQYRRGPIFSSIVLADEINRTTPKTQSSLLEVMERGKVTVEGQTYPVERPFMVVATQNPVDFEGTFPLPESQMDRFMMRISLGYPDYESELKVLQFPSVRYDELELEPVLSGEDLLSMQSLVDGVFIEESLLHYLVRLVHATRTETEFRTGISTRGLLALRRAAQARALIYGRDFILPDDILEMASPVLIHRLSLSRPAPDSMREREQVGRLLGQIVDALPIPT